MPDRIDYKTNATRSPISLPFPGRRARKIGKILIGFFLISISVLGSVANWMPGLVGSIGTLFGSNSSLQDGSNSNGPGGLARPLLNQSRMIGRPASEISLPKTVLSTVDGLVGAGGVIQSSPENMTLYNRGVRIRLVGGTLPHDELLDTNGALSSRSVWTVQALASNVWNTLLPTSNNIAVLGTNTSGTFVTRTQFVGNAQFSGYLKVAYKAISSGPLKWDLQFSPTVSGRYRLRLVMFNLTGSSGFSAASKTLSASFRQANYTIAWSDISSQFNSTATSVPGQFLLTSDLGYLAGGTSISLDPSIVGNVNFLSPTGGTFQRKVFYEPNGARYWVFYYDGLQGLVSNSTDGQNWWTPQALPAGLIPWSHTETLYDQLIQYNAPLEAAQPAVFYSGQTVLIAAGQEKSNGNSNGFTRPIPVSVYLNTVRGTISGPHISWGQVTPYANVTDRCDNDSNCHMLIGVRDVNIGVTSNGYQILTYNLYLKQDSLACGSGKYSESRIYAWFNNTTYYVDGNSGCGSFDQTDHDRSVPLPADSSGNIRIIYEFNTGTEVDLRESIINHSNHLPAVQAVGADKDTYAKSSDIGTNNVHGTDATLALFGGYPRSLVFMYFPTPIEFPWYQITSATLSIDKTSGTCNYYCLTTISESQIYWKNSLTYDGLPQNLKTGTGNPPPGPYWYGSLYLDGIHTQVVTPIVQSWYIGGNNTGFMFQLNDTSSTPEGASLASREDSTPSNRPSLAITYCCTGVIDTIDFNVVGTDEFSAVTDSSYNPQVVYTTTLGGSYNMTNYAFLSHGSWIIWADTFSGNSQYPAITMDYATNDVYVFAIQGTNIAMRVRSPSQGGWSESSITYPVRRAFRPFELTSNYFAFSSSSSDQLLLLWTETGGLPSAPYKVVFASIPIGVPWSPFSSPSDPWDSNGIIPYGQYFSNLDEQVSASTGMLTMHQTDLSVPGRGLNLEITRVYVEPYDFVQGMASNVEPYVWAPMGYTQSATGQTLGNSWQLNFPWMSSAPTPLYLHLWGGQGYRIPSSFWQGTSSSFENHQGESFRLVRNLDSSIILYTISGTHYDFDSSHRLIRISDQTGINNITLTYANNAGYNEISSIQDTVGRYFYLCYNADYLLNKIIQTSSPSTCSSANPVRSVLYSYGFTGYPAEETLTGAADPLGRITNYAYSSGLLNGPGSSLITRVSYPTGWYSNYTYGPASLGTEAISYRVSRVFVSTKLGARIREFDYSYAPSPGDRVSSTFITTFNGTSTQPVSHNTYDFSFGGVTTWILDGNNKQIRGTTQFFNVHGQVTQEIIDVSSQIDYQINGYVNYYQYDLWGNLIYTRRTVEGHWPISRVHDNFNSYFNGASPPRFVSFQDTFSDHTGTGTDNSWNTYNGTWSVNNGIYNGTATSYLAPGQSYFAYASIGTPDIANQFGTGPWDLSVQASADVTSALGLDRKFGIFAHYPGKGYGLTGYNKWALVLHNRQDGSGTFLELLDDGQGYLADTYYGNPGQPNARSSCQVTARVWYTLNMTVHGYLAVGTATAPGQPTCTVSGSFSAQSPASTGTSFGLYSAGYSTLFDNVTATTVTPGITVTGFSNSFIGNGAPSQNVHSALAGTAQLQNGTGTVPIETYYSYYPWGALNQAKQFTPTLGIDGFATSHCVNWLVSCSTTLSTSQPNDVIIVFADESLNQDNNNNPCSFNINDTAHLSWSTRTIPVFGRNNRDQLQEFWSKTANQLTSDTITESIAGCGPNYNGLTVFAVKGANFNAPFDPGRGIPSSNSDFSANTFVTLSTTNKNDIVFAEVLHGATVPSVQSGFTSIISNPGESLEYEAPAAALSNFGVTFGSSESAYWEEIGDVIQPALGPQQTSWPTSTITYDSHDNPKTYTAPNGTITYYDYSAASNYAFLTNQTLIVGQAQVSQLYTFNFTIGTLLSETDPMGNTTSYQYDLLGRLTKVTYPKALGYLRYSYSDSGNYVNITNENGWKTMQIYDGLGRLSTLERFSNGTPYSNQTYTSNWMNKVVSVKDEVGRTTSYQYDVLGRVISVTKPDGNVTQQLFVDAGGWVWSIDENGAYTYRQYDRLGRLLLAAAPTCYTSNGAIYYCGAANYYYDEVGNLAKVVAPNGKSTFYAYDGFNELVNTTYADGTHEFYSYDNNGNVVSITDRNNIPTISAYDSINRVKAMTHCGATTTTEAYTYDRNGNSLSVTSQNATISYAYDARSRVISESYAVNSGAQPTPLPCPPGSGSSGTRGGSSRSYSVGYSYNGEALGRITYPSNSLTLNYTYDSVGRVASVFKPGSTTYASINYDTANEVRSLTYGNGVFSNYTYDNLGRPQTVTAGSKKAALLYLAYAYTKTGQVSTVTGQVNTVQVSEQYTYQQLLDQVVFPVDSLTNASLTNGNTHTTIGYEYDADGNRLIQRLNGTSTGNRWQVTSYSYNPNTNELLSATGPTGTTSYGYDRYGNLVSRNDTGLHWTYAWDVTGNLLKVGNSVGVQGVYAYDALGRRVESIEGSTTIFQAYLGTETLYELANGIGTDYVYAGGLRIAKVTGSTAYYYHTDGLGSTRLVTDSSTNPKVIFSDSYQPFGQDHGTPSCTGTCEAYKFTGKSVSTTTGLFYYGARWYDPSIGRFISQDPYSGRLSNPQSLNQYIYVLDTPTSLTDPTGMDACGWDPSTWGGCVSNDWQGTVNWWNGLDPDTRTIIVAGLGTAAIILTAGAATPVVAGALIGAGVSAGVYTATHNPADPNGGFSLKGLIAATLTGSFFGALGGAAGPAGGTLSMELTGTTTFARLGTLAVLLGASTGFDALRGADLTTMGVDASLAVITFGVTDYFYPTPSIKTLAQLRAQSPSLAGLRAAFLAPPSWAPSRGAIARAAVWGSFFGALGGESAEHFFIDPFRRIFGS